ncbi:MAG: GNAT family N-acetyltransferase [Flavisolibacter sp.]
MLLLALAIAPGLAVCIYIFYRDVHDKEPALNLFMSFILGMLTIIPAAFLEHSVRDFADKSIVGILFSSFILIALIEEFFKFLALRYYGFNRRSFDEPLDGIIYGVMVSMGFATVENLLFVYEYGISTAILRIFTAVPAHASFGVIMGYYVGKAKFDPLNRRILLIKALIAATIAHGFYDSFLFLTDNTWIHQYIVKEITEVLLFAGAISSLIIAVIFSRRLIVLHKRTSHELYNSAPILTIRHANETDVTLIRNLAVQIWPSTYERILTQPQIRYMMNLMYSENALRKQILTDYQYIVVYNSGVPIGFASYREEENSVFKLHRIYLKQKQQGRGSGRFVIDQIISDIKPRGAKILRLNVNRYNQAKGFYEKLGFVVVGEEDVDIGGGFFMEDYVMERRID